VPASLPLNAGNGDLDAVELTALLRDLLPPGKLSAADVAYFSAVLDLEGNKSISEQEFLAVAKVWTSSSSAWC
jgi:hypothetical protein